jgi:hypothetical protein
MSGGCVDLFVYERRQKKEGSSAQVEVEVNISQTKQFPKHSLYILGGSVQNDKEKAGVGYLSETNESNVRAEQVHSSLHVKDTR